MGPKNGAVRYKAAHEAELFTINTSPAIAYKLSETVWIGAAAYIYWSKVQLHQFYPWAVLTQNPAQPDGLASFEGDGTGIGGHIGITWEFSKGHRIALNYRSQADVNVEGDFGISNLPAVASSLGFTQSSSFGTEINLPNIVGLGYGIQINDRLRAEVSGEWVEFSRLESFTFDIANNNLLLPSTVLPQNWNNTFTLGIAGDYELSSAWRLLGGYQHYESPVPDSTMTPMIPDSNQHAITVGLAYRCGSHRLEVSYGHVFYLTQSVDAAVNPIFPGEYRFNVHLLSLGYGFAF